MRRKNDILWKGILEEVFPDLLRFLFSDAELRFNMKRKVVFLDKELAELYPEPNKNSDTRFVDKLVKVYTTTGKANYLLIHIEVQGQYDREFMPSLRGRMAKGWVIGLSFPMKAWS